jgi:hypothetical protein
MVIFPEVTRIIPAKQPQTLAALLARGLTNNSFADRVWSVCGNLVESPGHPGIMAGSLKIFARDRDGRPAASHRL